MSQTHTDTPPGPPRTTVAGPPAADLVLAGGTLIDPASGRYEVTDVVVRGDRIVAITKVGPTGARVVDCSGQYVVPGLIDAHSHIFPYVSRVGAPPDEAHLRRGVVAVADAGSVGASTFEAFQRFVVDGAQVRILSFLNVSVLGLIDFRFGELLNPDTLSHEDAVDAARNHPGIVRGFKIRLSHDVVGDRCLELLRRAVAIGSEAGLPLMVHIGDTADPLPEILALLRRGDIVSHCYTGKQHGIVADDGRVLDAVLDAHERGVVFDSAHGKTNFSFKVARDGLAAGFLPDVISSDTSARNWRGPVFDLVTTMSKFLALGVRLEDIVRRTTIAPARLLGLDTEGYGSIRVDGPARISVLRILEDDTIVHDGTGDALSVQRIEPVLSVVDGSIVQPAPWRGTPA